MATMRKLFAGILGAVLLAGIAPQAQAQTSAVPTVTVLTSPVDSAAEIYIGKDLGFFAKHGLDVNIEPGTNGSAIAAAVAGNAVDIGYSDLVTLAKGYLKGIPFVAIAPAAIWTSAAPVAGLVVPLNSPITGAKDLAGKVIAVPGLGTLAEYSPRAWIDQNGGDSSTAKFTEMPYPAMPAALTAGRIDVAYISEPFLALVRKDVRVLGYSHNAIAKRFLQSAWFTTPQWAKDHPDVVHRFAAAMRETAIWANQKANQPKSAEILAKYTKIDLATIAVMERAQFAETLTAASIQPAIDVTAKYGKFQPFPADRLIYHAN
jgi:NitT/TauT family transport system substrate-binding protein